MSIICLFHKNCMDGRGAAAVVDRKHPGAKCFPMQYGDELPQQLTGADLHSVQLYIVDYSLPEHQMVQLADACRKVIWIDHHKTALEMGEKLAWKQLHVDTVTADSLAQPGPMWAFATDESGASLTWQILFPGEDMPVILEYIRDRDLWNWKLGFSREVSEALRVRLPGDDFKGLLDMDPRDLVSEGKRHWDKKMRQVSHNCERAYEVKFHNFRGMAVNAYEHISETGERLLEDPLVQVAIIYWREKGKWIHSLRSKAPFSSTPLVDVSELAKENGGGGHEQAAGFQGPHLHPSLDG